MLEAAETWSFEAYARCRWERALAMLLAGESLTKLSAAKDYGEWDLKVTLGEITSRGVKLARRPEIAFQPFLRPRLVVSYSLRPESRSLAVQLLAGGAGVPPQIR